VERKGTTSFTAVNEYRFVHTIECSPHFFIITVTIPETSHIFCENPGDFINHNKSSLAGVVIHNLSVLSILRVISLWA
jgi:hypothetical protein